MTKDCLMARLGIGREQLEAIITRNVCGEADCSELDEDIIRGVEMAVDDILDLLTKADERL